MRHQMGFTSISEITYWRVFQILSFKLALIFLLCVHRVSFAMNLNQPFNYIPFLYYHTLGTTILKNSRVPLKQYFVQNDMLSNS